jgi:ZIP family zinc transporter
VDALVVFLAACATALATGVGAIPVFFLGARTEALEPFLWGLAGGVMVVAAGLGLIQPAVDNGSALEVATGLAAGVAFLAISRRRLASPSEHVPRLPGAEARTAALVFGVLAIHSLPEGLAVGSAYASEVSGLAAFVVIGIALQNIPEGTSVAIPMARAGYGRSAQFWGAVLTSAAQPVGALFAFWLVDVANAVLPVSLAFAGAAMAALVAVEIVPRIATPASRRLGVAGALVGITVMLAVDLLLGV